MHIEYLVNNSLTLPDNTSALFFCHSVVVVSLATVRSALTTSKKCLKKPLMTTAKMKQAVNMLSATGDAYSDLASNLRISYIDLKTSISSRVKRTCAGEADKTPRESVWDDEGQLPPPSFFTARPSQLFYSPTGGPSVDVRPNLSAPGPHHRGFALLKSYAVRPVRRSFILVMT